MNLLVPVGVVALALVARSRRGSSAPEVDPNAPIPKPTPKPGESTQQAANRIIKEAAEIVDGKREGFSDPGANQATKAAVVDKVAKLKGKPAPKPNGKASSDDAGALNAAKLASRVPVAPSPIPKPTPKPLPVRPVFKPPAPMPAPKPTPQPAPQPRPAAQYPEGYDRAKAAEVAPSLAKHIAAKKFDYDRKILKAWQRVAGIAQDGIYGRGSAAALKYFTPTAPKALFAQGQDVYPWR